MSEEKWPRLLEGRQEPLEDLEVDYFKQVWRGEVIDSYAENAITGTLAIVLKAIHHLESFEIAQEQANTFWENRNKSRFV